MIPHRISAAALLPFALTLVLGLACAPQSASQTPTAAEAWQKIQHRYGPPPPVDTVDTLKGGDPSTPVTGIVTTFMDTMAVLQEAVRRGDNLIITHEPTFYNHRDETTAFRNDPVYKEKIAYIEQHHLVVYRLHDQIHADPAGDHILAGVYEAFGWEKYPHGPGRIGQYFATIPPTTLLQLAQTLQQRFQAETMRVEGDPGLAITHVALVPGAAGLEKQVAALNQPQVDVLIAGESAEWEGVEYVRDAVAQGRKKGLILLGHEVSEEPGMEQCAKELREVFPGMRVDHIVAGQPLWNPEHPPAAPHP
jgi:putative NIF3 family GTP cyclohydrolase 1 type 2